MAEHRWEPKALARKKVMRFTPGGTIGTETFTLTSEVGADHVVSYTAESGDTATEVVDGLIAALGAADVPPQFTELSVTDGGTYLDLEANEPGKPFTITSAATGSATLTASTPVANSSPEDFTDADNWSSAGVPVNGGDIRFTNGSIGPRWNLDGFSAITPNLIWRDTSFTGTIGLPDYADAGYRETRAREATFANCNSVRWEQAAGDDAQHARLAFTGNSTNATVYVTGTGGSAIGEERLWLRLIGNGGNVLETLNASVAVGMDGGTSYQVDTARFVNSTISLGDGALATVPVNSVGSTVRTQAAFTLTQDGEGAILLAEEDAASSGTMTIFRGTVDWRSTGNPGNATWYAGALFDLAQAPAPVTPGAVQTFHAGAGLNDPNKRLVRPFDVTLVGCDVIDLAALSLGRATSTVLTVT